MKCPTAGPKHVLPLLMSWSLSIIFKHHMMESLKETELFVTMNTHLSFSSNHWASSSRHHSELLSWLRMKWPDKDVVHEMFWWLCVLWQWLEKILFMNINMESKDIIWAVKMTLKWENVCSLLRMWQCFCFFSFIFNLVALSEIISQPYQPDDRTQTL